EALRRSRLSLEAAAKREARARLPAIDVVGIASYGSQDFEGNFDLETRVGVNVTVPIYSGNALTARRRRASAQAARAGGELDAARRELREAIEVTYRRALLLEAQASRRTTVRDLKTDEFEAALIEHSQGLRTLPLLVDVRLELEDAALAGIRAEYDLNRTELELLALTGQLLDGQRGVEG
ncbi:MAG: TolC family protein, partial [Pseudomonadota bacterium]